MVQAVPNLAEGAGMSDLRLEATAEAPATPAGWYPDPVDHDRLRWWSGSGWTDQVHEPAVPAGAAGPIVPAGPAVGVDPVASAETPVPAVIRRGPATQEEWHAASSRGPVVARQVAGTVSLSTGVPSAAARHDPYRAPNWVAGLALALAILAVPALGWRAVGDLPALTQSMFAGAPIAVSLLALVIALRRGGGLVLSVVAVGLSAAVLIAGLLVDPATLRDLTEAVVGLVPR